MNTMKKVAAEHFTRATGSLHHSRGDVKLEFSSNEVPSNNNLLNEQCERHLIKSEPSFYQDDELDDAYSNPFDSSSVQYMGETSEAETEKGVTVLAQSSDCTNKDQIGKRVKTELSYQDQDEELFSLAHLIGKVQSSPLKHPHDEKYNDLSKQMTKPYSCDHCNKSFSTFRYLNRHRQTRTCEKSFSCDQCEKTFGSSSYLVVHKRIHTGEKPYSCDQCSKSFSRYGYLVVHKRTHTGEKPCSCDRCKKSFICSGNLAKHKRTHSCEKPYSNCCDQCNKWLIYTGNFLRHKRTHAGEEPLSCEPV